MEKSGIIYVWINGGINDEQFGFSETYENILRADTKNKVNEKNAGYNQN